MLKIKIRRGGERFADVLLYILYIWVLESVIMIMAKGQGFFKGEKKKKKKSDGGKSISSAPVFTQPKVISKGKDKY